MRNTVMADIDDFFTRYGSAWRANSAAQIESFWDTSETRPFYKAEEIDHIIADWGSLRE